MTNEPRLTDFQGIIAFALAREDEAAAGYTAMMKTAETPGLKELFGELREEEREHKRLLEDLAAGGIDVFGPLKADDLGITDRLAAEPARPDMNFQDALIFAAEKEERAARLYAGLASRAIRPDHKKLFEALAGMEKIHKLKLETEYEKRVLAEG